MARTIADVPISVKPTALSLSAGRLRTIEIRVMMVTAIRCTIGSAALSDPGGRS
ncbi:MAG: hypothetical protein GX458_11475 [Phyllobacteriaceae bacterium]|nr:hypothetical protein [Phyllobacteriaceae bacterium]